MNKRKLAQLLRTAEKLALVEAKRRAAALPSVIPEDFDFEAESPMTYWSEAACLLSEIGCLRISLRKSVPSESHIWEIHLYDVQEALPKVRREWRHVFGARAPF